MSIESPLFLLEAIMSVKGKKKIVPTRYGSSYLYLISTVRRIVDSESV